jgi:hypothetical protein
MKKQTKNKKFPFIKMRIKFQNIKSKFNKNQFLVAKLDLLY